jgi:HEAT repeat protein
MKWRYLAWAVVAVAVIGFAAVMIPGSPVSLQNTIGDPESEGRRLREWTADLASPDRQVRLTALNAIDRIAPLSDKAAMPVAKLMQGDPDKEVREQASHVLYRIGAGAKPALDIATAALTDDSPEVRRNAVLFMVVLKADARPAVPALIKAMNDPRNETTVGNNETIQALAAVALGVASAGTAEAVPALTEVVASNRPTSLRTTAARALGVIGEPAKPAVPSLKSLLASLGAREFDAREELTYALRALGETMPDVTHPKAAYPSGYAGNSGTGGNPQPKKKAESKGGDKKSGSQPKKEGAEPTTDPAEKAPAPQPKKGG